MWKSRNEHRHELAERDDAAQLKLIIDNVPTMCVAYDEQLRCLFANRRYAESFGFTTDNILGMNLAEIIGEGPYWEVKPHFDKALAGRPTTYERRRVLGGREIRYLEVELNPHVTADGRVRSVFAAITDITDRKREEQLRLLGHSVANLIAEADSGSAAIRAVIRAICEAEHWECGRYFQLSAADGAIRLADAWGIEEPPVQDFLRRSRGIEYVPGDGLVGEVWKTGKALWISDVSLDARPRYKAVMQDFPVRGAFVFPVKTQAATIGVLAFNSRESRATDVRLLEAIQAIGSQIGQFLQRKRAEDELRHANAQLQMLVQSSPLAVYTRDASGLLTSWNPAAEAMFGWTAAEVLGKPLPSVPDEARADSDALRMRLLEGETSKVEVQRLRRDGTPIEVDAFVGPLLDAAGNIDGIIAVVADITERKQAERERREHELQLRQLTENIPAAIAYVDRNLVIRVANRRYVDMHLGPAGDAIDRHVREVIGETGWRDVEPYTQRVLVGEAVVFERSHQRPDGGRLQLQVQLQPNRASDGEVHGYYAFVLDITERKQAERDFAALQLQLRQSQKMEAIGTLAGGIAHDFNNIIGAILGNTRLASEDLDPDHPAMQSVAEIEKAGRRARDLVQQILTFSRKQPLSKSVMALGDAVAEAARFLQATLPAGVKLTTSSTGHLPNVSGDATQIHQVLVNLCTNAWHAMEGRPGRIDIDLAPVTVDAALAREHAGLHQGEYVRLAVRDTGKGMSEIMLERIFEPFFTTKSTDEGTGLGLPVVLGIVQGHDGAITVDSKPGQGTTFNIYFPAVDEPLDPLAAAAAAAAPCRAPARHVLYLDDDASLVFLVERMLRRKGYRVSGYTRAEHALDAVRADPGDFDLVVSDYNMPGMSGLDVARELSRIRPTLPVAVTSGHITDELRERAPLFDVRHLIYKPDTIDELCDTVARLTNEP